jgi:hypothetical protein
MWKGKGMLKKFAQLTTTIFLVMLLSLFFAVTTAHAAPVASASLQPSAHGHSSQISGSGHAQAMPVNTSLVPQTRTSVTGPQHPALASTVKDPAVPLASHGAVAVASPAKTGISPAVTVNSSFGGSGNTGWNPSDSTNAGGPSNIVETVNEQFTISDRTGNAQFSTTFQSWFGATGSIFDPRIVYDVWGGRFIMIVDTGTSILLSVSDQSSALGGWCNYSFGTITGFADYPSLGVDYNGVYFSVNMFNSSNTNELFELSRTQIESCSSANFTFWSNLIDSTGASAFTIAPADGFSFAGSEYLVSSRPGGACSLTLWVLTGTSLVNYNIGTLCYSPPGAASQLGSAATIETLDNRLYSANYLNGQVDVSLTGAYNWGGGNVNSVAWWFKINTNATLAQQGGFGLSGYWYFFPAMEQDGNGNAIIVYNSSSASSYVNVWYIALSAAGGIASNNALATGASAQGTSGTTRWGDFQSARLDPTDYTQIWICGQVAAGGGVWGTWNGDVSY